MIIFRNKFVTILESFLKSNCLEVGCDEAGRGCLAGPVVAAAVILPLDFFDKDLNDSKQLSAKKRDRLRLVIEKEAIDWAVEFIDNHTIDSLNILRASIYCMHKALDRLKTPFDHIIVDGNRFIKYKEVPHTCIVKGDAKYASIAAASILAKTYRDEFMIKISEEFPDYLWSKNMGYPTQYHRDMIAQFGTSPYHRLSFRLLDDPKLF